ncbi:hypothetical protein CJ030_MR2G024868 [Morella rubra]|uniref:Uncharacterized protein n=1 Tax=Morella rubra TaxID=262757 RepID=A0A6A1WHI3_9ROSI|nr:hypothetical protein CJ030_MR2G024868 [Morella rubra]
MDNTLDQRLLEPGAQEQRDLKRRIWAESKVVWRIAFPSILSRVTSFGMLVMTQLFLAQVAELDLAAYALVQTVLVRFVRGILVSCQVHILCYNF